MSDSAFGEPRLGPGSEPSNALPGFAGIMGQYAAQHEKRNPWHPSSKFDADVRGFGTKIDGMGASIDSRLILEVGVGSAVSASLARQIKNAVDCPDGSRELVSPRLNVISLAQWW